MRVLGGTPRRSRAGAPCCWLAARPTPARWASNATCKDPCSATFFVQCCRSFCKERARSCPCPCPPAPPAACKAGAPLTLVQPPHSCRQHGNLVCRERTRSGPWSDHPAPPTACGSCRRGCRGSRRSRSWCAETPAPNGSCAAEQGGGVWVRQGHGGRVPCGLAAGRFRGSDGWLVPWHQLRWQLPPAACRRRRLLLGPTAARFPNAARFAPGLRSLPSCQLPRPSAPHRGRSRTGGTCTRFRP